MIKKSQDKRCRSFYSKHFYLIHLRNWEKVVKSETRNLSKADYSTFFFSFFHFFSFFSGAGWVGWVGWGGSSTDKIKYSAEQS